ncbi:MAG: hypothetical protein ACI97A_003226 [Planctomycetota bacterium]|jgi:hypothetical protein
MRLENIPNMLVRRRRTWVEEWFQLRGWGLLPSGDGNVNFVANSLDSEDMSRLVGYPTGRHAAGHYVFSSSASLETDAELQNR